MGRRVSPVWWRAPLLCALLLAAACESRPAGDSEVAVSAAVVAEPVLGERAALYFVVSNRGAQDDELTEISTPAAEGTEIHRTMDHAGMMTMEPLGSLLIPAGATVRLAPGGHHVMLLNLTRNLAAGDNVRATLRFRRAGKVSIEARVVAYTELEHAIGTGEPRDPGKR